MFKVILIVLIILGWLMFASVQIAIGNYESDNVSDSVTFTK